MFILKSIEDGVIVLSKDLKIEKANETFARLFNIATNEITNVSFTELIAQHDKNHELYHKITLAISTKIGSRAHSDTHSHIGLTPALKRW